MMENKSIKHGITLILLANIINLFFNLATNFLLPKYLSIDTYAQIKSFILYTSYIGILHLGYSDGMYLHYGGKNIDNIPKRFVASDINTMRIFQLIITFVALIISLLTKDVVIIASAIVIAPINMANYYKYLLQATGEFQSYSRILNITTIFTSIFLLLLLLLKNYDNYIGYLAIYIVVDFGIWIYLEWLIKNKYGIHSILEGKFDISVLIRNIHDGILLMLGTFSNIILTGLDRWFVKILMNSIDFAMYSFAVSIEGLMNVVVTPISITFYNFFCTLSDKENLNNIKNKVILFSVYIVSCAYGAKFVVELFLIQYIDSVNAIFILFASQIFFIVTKCLYVNLYKAEKKQKIYFIKLVILIVLGIVYNVIFFKLLPNKEAFAIGTLLCGVTWLLISERDFKYCCTNIKEKLYLISVSIIFVLLGVYLKSIIGFLLYILIVSVLSFIIYKREYVNFVKIILDYLRKNIRGFLRRRSR